MSKTYRDVRGRERGLFGQAGVEVGDRALVRDYFTYRPEGAG